MVGQRSKFNENAFRLTNRLRKTIQREFFPAGRESNTQLVFDQLEMPVMVTEQDSGIGAFSQFEFAHESGVVSLRNNEGIVTD